MIRKIKARNEMHGKMLKPRQNLQATADELIAELQAGRIPEEKIHDFFSFWDREK